VSVVVPFGQCVQPPIARIKRWAGAADVPQMSITTVTDTCLGGAPRRGLRVALAAGCVCAGLIAGPGMAEAAIPYTAYTSNENSGTLTPINTATNLTGSTIAVGHPSVLAITPDGKTALVVNGGAGTVTPVALPAGTLGSPITVGTNPTGIAITPDGKTAYVANTGGTTVTPITLATGTAGTPITVGSEPMGIAITPDGATAYVSDHGSGSVTPITVASNTAGSPISVGTQPEGIAITPDGTTAYVANHGSQSITPILVATNTPGSQITVGAEPIDVAITPGGATAYVTNEGGNTVSPVTLSTGTAGSPIGVGSHPIGVTITPDGTTAYVANRGSNTVTPITVETNAAGTAINVGEAPDTVAVTPDEAPVASFTVKAGTPGSPTSFDASASSVAYGTITSYGWSFGDGSTSSTSSATINHTYAVAGDYTATLTETDSAGTSTTQVFTGQTVSRNGGASAHTAHTLTVSLPPGSTPPQPGAPSNPAPGSGDPPAGGPPAEHPTAPAIPTTPVGVDRHGVATISLGCPANASGGCHGIVAITIAEPPAGRARAARCGRGCRPLGTTSYEARAGQKVRVRVHIASFGRRLLARRHSVRVTLTATSVSGGRTATLTRAIVLKSATRA
jgi:YVTN family beta-propeller protein